MNKIHFRLLIFILFISGGCKKETASPVLIDEAKQPDIEVLDPMLLLDGGVRLSIKVNSVPPDLIYAYSILVSKDSLFREVSITRDFELPMRVKTYHYDLLSGLEQNAVYYYTYRINHMQNLYQPRKSFTFGKESKVVIDSISPRQAGIGDTLRVYGKFKDYNFIKATLGDSTMNLIRKAENMVEIPLDQKTPTGKTNVSLFTSYQRIVADSVFRLVSPRIVSIPKETTIGEEIIIQGQNFSPAAGQNKVFLNDVEVPVKSFSRTQLKVTIPNSITSVSIRVAVHTQNQVALSDSILKIRSPNIIELPAAIKIGDIYSLKFENLPNIPLEVRLDNQLLTVEYRSDQGGYNNLVVSAPIAAYPNKKPRLTLKYLDQTILLKETVEILDQWDLIAAAVPFDDGTVKGTLNVNGTVYVLAAGKEYMEQPVYYLWRFNAGNNTFSKIETPLSSDYLTVSAWRDNIYVYTGEYTDNFYQYNASTNSWKKLANYPAPPRQAGVMNSVNGNLYITTGQNPADFWNTLEDNSLYQYNVQTNQWKRMNQDYPIPNTLTYDNRIYGTSLSIGNEFYVLGGGRTTGNVEVYAFNTLNNTWSRKADYDAVLYATSLVKDGYGIVLSDHALKRYHAASDSWTALSAYLMPSAYSDNYRYYAFFTVGSNVYLVYGGLFFKMKLTDVLP